MWSSITNSSQRRKHENPDDPTPPDLAKWVIVIWTHWFKRMGRYFWDSNDINVCDFSRKFGLLIQNNKNLRNNSPGIKTRVNPEVRFIELSVALYTFLW